MFLLGNFPSTDALTLLTGYESAVVFAEFGVKPDLSLIVIILTAFYLSFLLIALTRSSSTVLNRNVESRRPFHFPVLGESIQSLTTSVKSESVTCSVVSNSLQTYGL